MYFYPRCTHICVLLMPQERWSGTCCLCSGFFLQPGDPWTGELVTPPGVKMTAFFALALAQQHTACWKSSPMLLTILSSSAVISMCLILCNQLHLLLNVQFSYMALAKRLSVLRLEFLMHALKKQDDFSVRTIVKIQ